MWQAGVAVAVQCAVQVAGGGGGSLPPEPPGGGGLREGGALQGTAIWIFDFGERMD